MASIEQNHHPHLPHLSSSNGNSHGHHHHHHKTISELEDPQEAVNDAESVPSSRSSSDNDEAADESNNRSRIDSDGDTTILSPTTTLAYDIKLKVLHPDPIADSQTLSPDELPDHWVPTMASQVARVTSNAFGQLASAASSPRQSSSGSRPERRQSQPNKEAAREEDHMLSYLTFQNPWKKSFRKPGVKEMLNGGLKWGLPDSYTEGSGKPSFRSSGFKSNKKIRRQMEEAGQQDKELGEGWDEVENMTPDWGWPKAELKRQVDHIRNDSTAQHQDSISVQRQGGGEPDYTTKEKPLDEWKDPKVHSRSAARVTWLGHATTLLQLPPISPTASSHTANGAKRKEDVHSRSINILFDPIFSERCSPSQSAGPQRFTPAPCKVEDLPPIDFVIISHSHYDHLDYHTMKNLHHLRGDKIHAFVGLGVKDKLCGTGGFGWKKEQVTELDWWNEALLTLPSSGGDEGGQVRVVCTPAQHGSGRGAGDKDASLWASWVVEWTHASHRFTTFFAGDTGLKYHHDSPNKRAKYPPCPAFAEIANRFSPLDVLLLPISVGSSLSYFRSWDPFPRAMSPFPRVSSTLTSSIHMDPYDAVECHRIFQQERGEERAKRMVSLAVHYGTFVRNDEQTKGDVRELRKACIREGLKFARVRDGASLLRGDSDEEQNQEQQKEKEEEDVFLVADQGKTVWLPIHTSS